ERVRARVEVLHRDAAGVVERDRERAAEPDVSVQRRIVDATGTGAPRGQEQQDEGQGGAHTPSTPRCEDRFAHARSMPPNFPDSASTIFARSGATSSSVSVRSGDPNARRKASERLPSPVCSPRYSSKTE